MFTAFNIDVLTVLCYNINMYEIRQVDPMEMQVGDDLLDYAGNVVRRVPLLRDQAPEKVEHAVQGVAKMLAAVEKDLIDAPSGARFAYSLPCSFENGEEKALFVSGLQTGGNVEKEIFWLDKKELQAVLEMPFEEDK